ncbi:P pilus assembly/Cpx signaling pathway, periplasmic inhibitor/zinc-resistance associated protein [Citrifermentans bremense]|uniref:Universal stress protein n=2 Tax=Geobacteraceae TaxID=213422 RepID=A0ABQ0MDZ6_9BACT|nr:MULTISPECIES: Spy/CpxP family protein refolding chaperone [Geobacteraceae]BCG48281.1 P pilus assembly/Cpx signaling pathway, periplasmic inhibitor/zinc-resistance associated protein [Citrifermentans bremense]GAW65333.1 universal stress protein [Geoanaerobacter pelophilus]
MKRNLRKLGLVACITAAAAFGGQTAFAEYTGQGPTPAAGQHQKHRKGHRDGHFFKRMASELNLTDQQQAQAQELFKKSRQEHKPLMESLRAERSRLQDLVHSGGADEAAIREQAAKVAAVQADLAVARAQGAKQFLALLTPKQAAQLKEFRAKRGERFSRCGGPAGPEF